MNPSHHDTETDADEQAFRKLEESAFFQTYREAFEAATGLPLALVSADGEACVGRVRGRNGLCDALNEGGGCGRCLAVGRELRHAAEQGSATKTCFAGLRESAVPVRSGDRVFALLVTGAVAGGDPSDAAAARSALAAVAGSPETLARLVSERERCPSMPLARYRGGVTLLATFALQLSDLLNRLLIEEAHAEPEVVVRAKRYVNANLEEKISLETVARHVGVSPYYFCKVFKQSAGMTLTEYVNRRRVEWAKRRLADPRTRVTEVAFDVGFQSISQFNRSFLKYVGESPTRYRERKSTQARQLRAAA
jgi:AraC-like DNA-binding protein